MSEDKPKCMITMPTEEQLEKLALTSTTHVLLFGDQKVDGSCDMNVVCIGTERECEDYHTMHYQGSLFVCYDGRQPTSMLWSADELRREL